MIGGDNMNKNEKSIKNLVFSALGIALVAICTMVIKVPVPATGGYVNFGDIMIFIVSIILGKKNGFLAGAFGSCLADILMGYIIFAPGTFIIKGIEGFLCGFIYEKLKDRINSVLVIGGACLISGLFMVFGYFIYETLIFTIEYSIAAVIPNLVQGIVSAIAAIPMAIAFKKATKGMLKEYTI